MDKFSLLLNESTILDFKLLWKLTRRYRSHLILSVIFCLSVFLITYFVQPVRFSVSVPLKAVSNHKVASDLSALLPADNSNEISYSELKISIESNSFLKSYADLVIKNPDFDLFNLGKLEKSGDVFGSEIKLICVDNPECLSQKVESALAGTYTIDQGLTENRFTLTISGKDKKTVQHITPILLKALENNRIQGRKYLVLKEIQSVTNLIIESRSIIQQMDGYKGIEEQEKLQNNILDLKEKISHIQTAISAETTNVTTLESRLIENKKTTKKKTAESRDEFERMQKLQAKLVEVQQNISMLTNIPEDQRSEGDHQIISQLKKERDALKVNLPSELLRKSAEVKEHFVDGQIGKTGDFEFDLTVARNKLSALQSDYVLAKEEINGLFQQKIVNENKVVGLKGDLEFLKSLENKQMSLKLISATLTSDLQYEDPGIAAREYRQSTILKIFIFSFTLTFFLFMISIVIRFIVDEKIYGEDEVKMYFKDLDFVGEVPIFE